MDTLLSLLHGFGVALEPSKLLFCLIGAGVETAAAQRSWPRADTATAAATSIGIGVLLDYGIGGGWALGAMGVIFVFVAVYYKLAQNRF